MHQAISDKALHEYCQTGRLPAGVRPNSCARDDCPEKSQFHRHSHYPRTCVYRQGSGWLPVMWVERFRCALCGKVFSLILPFVYKWQRAEHVLQQGVALGDPAVREEAAEQFSERTLLRWRQKWHAWSFQFLQAILQWLFSLYSFLSADVAAKQTRTPLEYLQALLTQLPDKALGAVAVVSVSRFGGRAVRMIPHILSVSFP